MNLKKGRFRAEVKKINLLKMQQQFLSHICHNFVTEPKLAVFIKKGDDRFYGFSKV